MSVCLSTSCVCQALPTQNNSGQHALVATPSHVQDDPFVAGLLGLDFSVLVRLAAWVRPGAQAHALAELVASTRAATRASLAEDLLSCLSTDKASAGAPCGF